MGLACLSSMTNHRKRAMYHRNLFRSGPQSLAAQSLAHSTFRKLGIDTSVTRDPPPLNWNILTTESKHGQFWFKSLLEETATVDRFLCVPPTSQPRVENQTWAGESILNYPFYRTLDNRTRQWLLNHNAQKVGAFREYDQRNNKWIWSDFSTIGPLAMSP